VVDEDWQPHQRSREDDRNNCGGFTSNDGGDDGGPLHYADSMNNRHGSSSNMQFNRVDSNITYKLPADPWVLRVRWRKDGMYPPGIIPPGSTHSSSIDLRRHSIASLSSTGGSILSQEVSSPPKYPTTDPVESVAMHLDIQLYEMEPGVYLVDFKCAGYETLEGMLLEEKDVTSPFPFLDLASKLIIQLAEAD